LHRGDVADAAVTIVNPPEWADALMSAVKASWRATSPAFDGGSIEAA
jgi:hypothetical protein